MFRFTKNRVAVGVGAVAALVLAAGAYAYFSSTGTGTGSASVGTATSWAVATTAGTVHNDTALTPQVSTCGSDTAAQLAASTCVYETVPYSVKNNSTGYQKLQNVAISVANNDGTAWTAVTGCSKSDFSIDGAGTGTTANDASQAANLAPGAAASGTLTIVMVDSGSSQDGCKNATVPLYLSAS